MNSNGIVAATVTYGDRLQYLSETVRRAFQNPAIKFFVIIDNDSRSDLHSLESIWGDRVKIVHLGSNTGSANGYWHAINEALKTGHDYILLLDDDNAPAPGAVEMLQAELARLSSRVGDDKCAVVGYRRCLRNAFISKISAYPPKSNFMWFHILTLPSRIWMKLKARKNDDISSAPAVLDVPHGPYGGLFAHRSAFQRNGLPKREFVLYGDDTEYTLRFTLSGGKISMLKNAVIEDLETSWYTRNQAVIGLSSFLYEDAPSRIYYSLRNHTWICRHLECGSLFLYRLNKHILLTSLLIIAVVGGRLERFRLIMEAVRAGETGRLGPSERHPLPWVSSSTVESGH